MWLYITFQNMPGRIEQNNGDPETRKATAMPSIDTVTLMINSQLLFPLKR